MLSGTCKCAGHTTAEAEYAQADATLSTSYRCLLWCTWYAAAQVLHLHAACCLGVLQRTIFWLVGSYAALFCADFQAAFLNFDNVAFYPAFYGVVYPYFRAKRVAGCSSHTAAMK